MSSFSHAVDHGATRSRRHVRESRGTPVPPDVVHVRTNRPPSLPPDAAPDPQELFRAELAELIRTSSDARLTACYALILAIHERHRSTGIGHTDGNFQRLVELKGQIGTGVADIVHVNELWALVIDKLYHRDYDSLIGLLEAFVTAVRPSPRLRTLLEVECRSIARSIRNARGDDRPRVLANIFDRLRTKL